MILLVFVRDPFSHLFVLGIHFLPYCSQCDFNLGEKYFSFDMFFILLHKLYGVVTESRNVKITYISCCLSVTSNKWCAGSMFWFDVSILASLSYEGCAVVFWSHYHHLRPPLPPLLSQQLPLQPPALGAVVVNVQSGEWASEGGGNMSLIYFTYF